MSGPYRPPWRRRADAGQDGKEAAGRIELFVGRDLQFIRVNGTIVGGLAGLLIYTVSVLL